MSNPFENISDEENQYEEQGRILYCALGYQDRILSNHSDIQLGMELENIVSEVISRLEESNQAEDSKKFGIYNINTVIDEEGVFALCITEQLFPLSESLYFLRTLKSLFQQQYSTSKMESAKKYGISSFNKQIKKQIDIFNDYDNHRLAKIKRDQEETQAILNEDIEKLLDRGELLDVMEYETLKLVENTTDYVEEAEEVESEQKCQFSKIYIVLILVALACVAVLAVWFGCGLQFQRCSGARY